MKKTVLMVVGGVIIAFAVLYIIEKTTGKSGFGGWLNGNRTEPAPAVIAPKAYPKLRNQTVLYTGIPNYTDEVEVLQRFLRAMGQNVPVSGIYDEVTENAVKNVTTKGTTSLQEIRFSYMSTAGLKDVADKIVRGEL